MQFVATGSGKINQKGSYRIIKLIARISPGERKLTDPEVQQSIREALHDRKEQLLRAAYLAELRDQAHVTNYLARQILATAGHLPAGQANQPATAPASPSPSSATPTGGTAQPAPSKEPAKPSTKG